MTTLKIQDILGLQFASKVLFSSVSESGLSKRKLLLFEVEKIQDKKKFIKCLTEAALPDSVPKVDKIRIQDIAGITIEHLKLSKKDFNKSEHFAFSLSAWSYNSKCFTLEISRREESQFVEYLTFAPHFTKRSVTTSLNRLRKHFSIK